MNTLWETIQEFLVTLSTLAKAQTVLVPLIASWGFTAMWVYATERKQHGRSRGARAFLGLFWLPGFLIYYIFPGQDEPAHTPTPIFAYKRTPKTLEAPRARKRRQDDVATWDGINDTVAGPRGRRANQETSDGTTLSKQKSVQSRRQSPDTHFYLEVLNGPLKGKKLEAKPEQSEFYIGVGSEHNNQIILSDDSVAPWHVIICYEKSGDWVLQVRDNIAQEYKTEINGRSATVMVLKNNDEIQLGNIQLRFHE